MKNQISQAIILRIKEFGESDLLVTFFTPEEGQVKGVAKGAKRSRQRFVNCLDTCSLVNLEYDSKKEGALCFLHSGKLIDAYAGLRNDFLNLSKASFMIELTEILFPLGLADFHMFELLRDSFDALAGGKKTGLIPVIFEARATAIGGYGINFQKCCICQRPYTGSGIATFKREKGGIACLGCQKITNRTPGIQPDSVRAMKQMQTESLSRSLEMTLSAGVLTEIKRVQKLHREYRLEKELKTTKYIE